MDCDDERLVEWLMVVCELEALDAKICTAGLREKLETTNLLTFQLPFVQNPPNMAQKHRFFRQRPLEDAVLTDLPGIGPAMAARLEDCNINNPKNLIGQYLVQAGWHACGGDA